MKVSFGIVNYNRLFYLKSCAETLMESVKDYDGEIEFICIDDNSKEPGTQEYLQTLADRGWAVINQEDHRQKAKKDIGEIQDVIDEFSAALNLFFETSTGEIIAPLQGDMQFIRKGWLQEYISLFEEREDVFAAMFDAQRKVRLDHRSYDKVVVGDGATFAVQAGRIIPGAGDCFYRREYVDKIGAWHIDQESNAEDIFSVMADQVFYGSKKVYVPWFPVSIAIYTDPRGTMGRVRGNVRYGLYWEALTDNRYYEWVKQNDFKFLNERPLSIEEVASPNGDWEMPVDENGNWKKNPIRWPIEKENVPCEIIY